MDPKIAAAISYIWIVGVIFFILEKENKFVRFHALQSILFGVANSIIMVLLGILAFVLTVVFGIGGAMVGGPMESLDQPVGRTHLVVVLADLTSDVCWFDIRSRQGLSGSEI